jgi:hypothetical protein
MSQTKQQQKAVTPPSSSSFTLSDSLKQRILWLLFASWVVLVFVGISYHEQWRDEGSDWTTVRHVSIKELFGTMIPQIGHPPLWYFLMYPLGNMGLPLVTVNIVSAAVMALAMYVMLFKLKIPFYLKVALVFSIFFMYEYPVVGRNYGLVVLFLMLTLWYYPKRFENPLVYALIVVGLYNTHSMVFPMAFAIMILYFWELVEFKKLNGKTALASVIMIVGGGYLIPYMAMPGLKAASKVMHIPDHYIQLRTAVGNGMLVGAFEDTAAMGTLAMLISCAMLVLLAPRLKPFAVFVCGAGGLLYILTYKYNGQHRHHGLLMVEFLFTYGLARYYADDRFTLKSFDKYKPLRIGTILLAACLFWQSYCGFLTLRTEIDTQFSDGKAAAEFLMDNHLEHKILVGHQSWAASSVLQQLPADCKMYWADTRRWGYFIKFDSLYEANQYRFPMGDYAAVVAEEQFKKDINQVVLVLNFPIQTPQIAALWTEKYRGGMWAGEDQKPAKSQESFIIYVRNPQYPAAVNMPPVDSLFKQ